MTLFTLKSDQCTVYVNTLLFALLHFYMLQPSKGPSAEITDTFREQGQQNMCPDVNIILKSSVLYVTQQCVHGAVCDREHTQTSGLLKLLSTYSSQYSYTDELATILHTENDRRVRWLF